LRGGAHNSEVLCRNGVAQLADSLQQNGLRWVLSELPQLRVTHTSPQANINEKPTPSDGWSACAKTVQKHDENIVKNWKEEIDTLLVFVRVTDVCVPDVI